jgi:NDP-sugar pyrophosphorylase family protein
MINIGVIPAAGRGLRLTPYTENTPKTLFEVGGLTLLERNIDILVHKVGVRKIYIIYGHLGHQIIETLTRNKYPDIDIEYVECAHPEIGLARGLLLLKGKIHEPFVTLLGDELYLNSNHEILQHLPLENLNAAVGYLVNADMDQIQQNYSLEISKGWISTLIEKPQHVTNDLLGCGTFVFTPKIFAYIESTEPSKKSGKVELIDALNRLAKTENSVKPVLLTGHYQNINYERDYINATHLYRKEYFRKYKTSLIIPAYNEEASLRHVIDEFSGKVDEILIAASFSDDNTVQIAQNSGCKTLIKKFAGYGDALKQGMAAASGDILILVEADGSFSADDLPKLLSYLHDADMVIGTRTTKQLILQGANMSGLLRWGNLLAAKYLQFLWFSPENRFTDLGCTYRALWRECFDVIQARLEGNGPEFSPEMMVEVIRAKRKIIEIPVTYRPRMGGESKHSRDWTGILKTATRMLAIITRKRFNSKTP